MPTQAPAANHTWPTTIGEARAAQERLRGRVETTDRINQPIRRIAGLDAHYAPRHGLVWAAAAVLTFPELELVESALASAPPRLPYVPGYLSFREAPAMLAAIDALGGLPDLLLIDGQGLAHPRRLGLACHVGVLADLPAIGVAKSRLVGAHRPPGARRSAWTPLAHRGQTVGAVLRTRGGTRPLYVSTGHRVSLPTAIDIVLECAPRFRLPEPIRLADRLSRLHP